MTKPLTQFAALAAGLSAPYLAALGYLLAQPQPNSAAIGSIVVAFTAILTSLERTFEGRDAQRSVRYSLRTRYSLVSLVASSLGATLWSLQVRNGWLFLALEAGLVAAIVGGRFLADRANIKNSPKHKLFQ